MIQRTDISGTYYYYLSYKQHDMLFPTFPLHYWLRNNQNLHKEFNNKRKLYFYI